MISFRKLQDTNEDYLQMTQWLNNSFVRKYYGYDDFPDPPSLSDVKRKYKKKVLNINECNPNIILVDDIPIGYIQYYKTEEYFKEKNIYGIDLFIGNDDYRGKGYGSAILKLMTNHIINTTNARRIVIDPDIKNETAIKCYLKSGFKKFRVLDNNLIMVINNEKY